VPEPAAANAGTTASASPAAATACAAAAASAPATASSAAAAAAAASAHLDDLLKRGLVERRGSGSGGGQSERMLRHGQLHIRHKLVRHDIVAQV
jgi:membrane protein involved in colicin uptake